jgi:hypothetical protein
VSNRLAAAPVTLGDCHSCGHRRALVVVRVAGPGRRTRKTFRVCTGCLPVVPGVARTAIDGLGAALLANRSTDRSALQQSVRTGRRRTLVRTGVHLAVAR